MFLYYKHALHRWSISSLLSTYLILRCGPYQLIALSPCLPNFLFVVYVTLDLIVTNLHGMYENPHILAPLGTSDHNIVHWSPVSKDVLNSLSPNSKSTKYLRRFYPRSVIDSSGRWMSSNNWFADLSIDSSSAPH